MFTISVEDEIKKFHFYLDFIFFQSDIGVGGIEYMT